MILSRRLIALASCCSNARPCGALGLPGPGIFPAAPSRSLCRFPPAVLRRAGTTDRPEDDRGLQGQPVVIENRPGANTVIGAQIVKRPPRRLRLDGDRLDRSPPDSSLSHAALRPDQRLRAMAALVSKTMQLLIVNSADDAKTVSDQSARPRSIEG